MLLLSDSGSEAEGVGDLEGIGDVVRQPEPDTTHGVDHLDLGRSFVELATEVGEMHVDDMVVANPLRTPHGVKQIFSRANLGRSAAELFEERELDTSCSYLFFVDSYFTPTEVDRQRAEDKS